MIPILPVGFTTTAIVSTVPSVLLSVRIAKESCTSLALISKTRWVRFLLVICPATVDAPGFKDETSTFDFIAIPSAAASPFVSKIPLDPSTCKSAPGPVVPMPTLPFDSIRTRSTLAVSNVMGMSVFSALSVNWVEDES